MLWTVSSGLMATLAALQQLPERPRPSSPGLQSVKFVTVSESQAQSGCGLDNVGAHPGAGVLAASTAPSKVCRVAYERGGIDRLRDLTWIHVALKNILQI